MRVALTAKHLDEPQADLIDSVEAGGRVSGPVRLAFQVHDVQAAVQRGRVSGARLLNGPVDTPWKHRNARLTDPEGNQLTLFQIPQ